MPEDQIQHLYEILDQNQVEEQVLQGLRRLLYLLKQHVSWYSWYSSYYPANTLWEAKQQLHEVRSILSALALAANYQGHPYYHVSDAFDAIGSLLQYFWYRREQAIAAAKEGAASGTSKQQAEGVSLPPTPSHTSGSEAQEKPNTEAQEDHSPVPEAPVLPPFVAFMVKLATEFGVTATKMKKGEVMDRIEERWDPDALGEPSGHKLGMMATMLRPPEAQEGRVKPKS